MGEFMRQVRPKNNNDIKLQLEMETEGRTENLQDTRPPVTRMVIQTHSKDPTVDQF